MTTLYFTRHGETEWNKKGIMQGWKDSKLTEKGRSHATALGKSLQEISFDKVFSSPSGRTLETAQFVVPDATIITQENLKEIHLGVWEGMTHDEIEELYPLEKELFWTAPHLYEPVSGESFLDVRKRAQDFLNKMAEEDEASHIMVVTHAVTLKSIMSIIKNLPLERLWDPPFMHGTNLTVVKAHQTGFDVLKEADMSHVEKCLASARHLQGTF